MNLVRAARANIRYHLRYIGYLVARAELARRRPDDLCRPGGGGASLVRRFLGDVPWDEDEAAKHWYARMKSRPSFRPLLADRLPGFTPAPSLRGPRLLKAAAQGARASRRARSASTSAGVARARRDPASAGAARSAGSAEGAHGDMDWMAPNADAARRSARALAGGALRRHARHELRAGRATRSRDR